MNEQLQKAVKEYNSKQSVRALEIAIKYGVEFKRTPCCVCTV